MGLMDKAKELAAKAEQAVQGLDGPNPTREAEGVFRDLGAKVFEQAQGRGDDGTQAAIDQLIDRLRTLEAQAGGRLATVSTSAGPPPPGAAAAAAAAPPPPGGAAAPPPPPGPAAAAPPPPAPAAPSAPPPPPAPAAAPPPPPPPPGAVAPPPPPGTV